MQKQAKYLPKLAKLKKMKSKELLKKRLEVDVPPRCTTHQCVKSITVNMTKGCVWCEFYHKDISYRRCIECLSTEELDLFLLKKEFETDSKYQQMVEGMKDELL